MDFLYGVLMIAHCDLKPANILKMDADYNLMISDFGISKKGEIKDTFQRGIEILAKQTVLAEGCRGSLS